MNHELFLNYKYGLVGLLAYPFYFFVEFLGPIIETIGYILFVLTVLVSSGIQEVVLLFFITAVLMGVLLSTVSLFLEVIAFKKYNQIRELLTLFLYCLLENFGYKQINTFWRLQGIIDLVTSKEGWGIQNRKGFNVNKDE